MRIVKLLLLGDVCMANFKVRHSVNSCQMFPLFLIFDNEFSNSNMYTCTCNPNIYLKMSSLGSFLFINAWSTLVLKFCSWRGIKISISFRLMYRLDTNKPSL